MLFTNSLKYDLVGLVVSLFVIIVTYSKWKLGYWKRRGIETLPASIPFGNTADLFLNKKAFGQIFKDFYFKFKSKGLRHGGVYFSLSPTYLPIDVEIVKNILQHDFQYFVGHGLYVNEHADPLSANLFNFDGPKWKSTRIKLTPTFTSGKIKMMAQTLLDCSHGLKEMLDSLYNEDTSINIKNVMARFTTDIIGSCAFGIDCNSMKNTDSEFRKYGLLAVELDFITTLKQFAQLMVPHEILRLINFKVNDSRVIKFFLDIVNETIAYREKNNIIRKDFMHLLLQIKNKGKLCEENEEITGKNEEEVPPETMTVNEIAAQSFIFFIAGFETSSTTMNFAAFELASNLHIQDKLREEINTVLGKHDNILTYEAIMEMTYLDKLLRETLRKHPPLPELVRICSKDYNVPGTDVVIEKGTNVVISILGIHHDPEYYPNPEIFDPERFSDENKSKRPSFTWIPFGEGPRICIGLRFGMLQSKIGLITLVKHYKLTLNKKTQLPIVLKKRGVISSPESDIWIDIHKIQN